MGVSVFPFWPFCRSVFRFIQPQPFTSLFGLNVWSGLRFYPFLAFGFRFSVFDRNTSGLSDWASEVVVSFSCSPVSLVGRVPICWAAGCWLKPPARPQTTVFPPSLPCPSPPYFLATCRPSFQFLSPFPVQIVFPCQPISTFSPLYFFVFSFSGKISQEQLPATSQCSSNCSTTKFECCQIRYCWD